jgi:hypothetical protein
MHHLVVILCIFIKVVLPPGEAGVMAHFMTHPVLKPTPPPRPTKAVPQEKKEKSPRPDSTMELKVGQPSASPARTTAEIIEPAAPATATVQPTPVVTATSTSPHATAPMTSQMRKPSRTPAARPTGTITTASSTATSTSVLAPARFSGAHVPATVSSPVPSSVLMPLGTLAHMPATAGNRTANEVLLVAVIVVGVLQGFSFLQSSCGFRSLKRSYRRHKRRELRQLQAHALAQQKVEVRQLLAQDPEGWRQVLSQLVADALGGSTAVGKEGVLELSAQPAPHLTVAGNDHEYTFTTQPDLLDPEGVSGITEKVIPLNATLHLAASVEMQAVWDHLATQRLREQALVLPRRSTWFLVVGKRPNGGRG